jgi:hypothetical protein
MSVESDRGGLLASFWEITVAFCYSLIPRCNQVIHVNPYLFAGLLRPPGRNNINPAS